MFLQLAKLTRKSRTSSYCLPTGIPVQQQSLIYKETVLPDDACLAQCGIRDGATLSLVLKVSSALTNVMVGNEPVFPSESVTDWLDLDAMDILDVTGLDEKEQDDLLSVLFGPTEDSALKPRTFVLCRDGDKINVLQLGGSHFGLGEGLWAGDERAQTPIDPHAHSRDQVPLQDRLRRLQENARHRTNMQDLQNKMREKKKNRRQKQAAKAGASAATGATAASSTTAAAEDGAGPAVVVRGDEDRTFRTTSGRTKPGTPHARCIPLRRTCTPNNGATMKSLPPTAPTHPHPHPPSDGSGPAFVPAKALPSIHSRGQPHVERTPERHRDGGGSAGDRSQAPHMLQRNYQRDLAADLNAAHDGRTSLSRRSQYANMDHPESPMTPGLRENISVTPRTQRRDNFQLTPLSPLAPCKSSGADGCCNTFQLPSLGSITSPTAMKSRPDMLMEEQMHLDGLVRDAGGKADLIPVKIQPLNGPKNGKKARRRCAQCNRRLKLAGTYSCRCSGTFCGQCRYAEVHNCTYDYKTHGRKILEASAPSIQAPKLPKI